MLYVLFGEMGIGKNYVGELLANHIGCKFFDGDLAVPETMAKKVANFRPLGADDINDYVGNHLIPAINERFDTHLVVAQALYREVHREMIMSTFGRRKVKLVWLPVVSHVSHFKRLLNRENGWKWIAYAMANKPFFQKPKGNARIILNKDNIDLTPQFEGLVK